MRRQAHNIVQMFTLVWAKCMCTNVVRALALSSSLCIISSSFSLISSSIYLPRTSWPLSDDLGSWNLTLIKRFMQKKMGKGNPPPKKSKSPPWICFFYFLTLFKREKENKIFQKFPPPPQKMTQPKIKSTQKFVKKIILFPIYQNGVIINFEIKDFCKKIE